MVARIEGEVMATTEPVTPPRPQPSEGGGPILGTLLPLAGFVVLALARLAALGLAPVLFYRPAWLGVPADQEPILRRTLEPMGHVAGVEIPGVFWWLILLPVLAVGFTYVIVLYVRDGRAVGAPWALF